MCLLLRFYQRYNITCDRPFTSPLGAEEYITIDNEEVNNEMITNEEIIASFKPIEEEVDIESKVTIPKVSIKDAVNALETDCLQFSSTR